MPPGAHQHPGKPLTSKVADPMWQSGFMQDRTPLPPSWYEMTWRQLDRRSRSERDALIRTLSVELFYAHGYEAVGIRQIASGLGINSATLYHYYQSKIDILTSIMESTNALLIETTTGALKSHRSAKMRLACTAGILAAAQTTSRKTCYVVDNEIRAIDRDAPAGQRILAYRREYEHLWDSAIGAGLDEGVFTCPNPTLARLALLGMFTSTSLWYHPNPDYDAGYVALELVDASLNMLKAEPLSARDRRAVADALDFTPFDCEPRTATPKRQSLLEFSHLQVE